MTSLPNYSPGKQQGFSLIEVLVTIVILVLGMLGMAGIQARAVNLEYESYQRGQAILLLEDMVGRINSNATNVAGYVTTGVGTGDEDTDCTSGEQAAKDLCEWGKLLKGASEATSATNKVGAMVNGLGCIRQGSTANQYYVSVAWQGLGETVRPVDDCGHGSTLFRSDMSRRVVSAVVQIPSLAAE